MPRTSRRRPAAPITCPACGSDKAQVIQRKEQFHEPDVQGWFVDEITKCDVCGEEVFSFEQAEAHSRAYAAAVARARNAMEPPRIYDLRMVLGWTQSKMEEAFGIGPKTWGRWERGTVPPSGPAARLLWLAENDRPAFLRMVEVHDPRRKSVAKIVGSIAQLGLGEDAIGFNLAKSGPAKSVTRRAGRPSNGSATSGGTV